MLITTIIIGITVLVSAVSIFNKEYFHKLEYTPFKVKHDNQWYRLFSHALVHADWFHLMVNMYVLYHFGKLTEYFYETVQEGDGTLFYLILYVGGVMFAALPAYKKHQDNYNYNAIGASGAVSAVLFAAIMFIPLEPLRIMFVPIDIPAFIFGVLYIGYETYMNKRGGDYVAHDAHLWGAMFGVVFPIIMKPQVGLTFIEQVLSFVF
jgi:membrane associated rhomboid family serine protease